jgi:hypothetical protein
MKNKIYLIVTVLLLTPLPGVVLAYVAESSSYRIEADSINFGGGESASSASYNLSDTLGEVGTGSSASTNYNLHAGYRAMQSETVIVTLALTPPTTDVALAEIGEGGGHSAGTANWTVTTNNPGGYQLTVRAEGAPALASDGDAFADYTPAEAVPDYSWSSTTEAEFGFTPEGDDIHSRYLDNGTNCGVGSSQASAACWDGLSTTDRLVAERANATAGSTITLRFQAEVASDASLANGDYRAVIIVTATTL